MKIDREKFLAAALIAGAMSSAACKGKSGDDLSADPNPNGIARSGSPATGPQTKVISPTREGGPAAEGLPPPSREGLPPPAREGFVPPGGRPPGATPAVVTPPGGRPPGPKK